MSGAPHRKNTSPARAYIDRELAQHAKCPLRVCDGVDELQEARLTWYNNRVIHTCMVASAHTRKVDAPHLSNTYHPWLMLRSWIVDCHRLLCCDHQCVQVVAAELVLGSATWPRAAACT